MKFTNDVFMKHRHIITLVPILIFLMGMQGCETSPQGEAKMTLKAMSFGLLTLSLLSIPLSKISKKYKITFSRAVIFQYIFFILVNLTLTFTLFLPKHWQPNPPVGKEVVEQLIKGIEAESADLGMVITSGSISDKAVQAAETYFEEKGIKIELVDGKQFAKLIVEHGISAS